MFIKSCLSLNYGLPNIPIPSLSKLMVEVIECENHFEIADAKVAAVNAV